MLIPVFAVLFFIQLSLRPGKKSKSVVNYLRGDL